MEDFFTQLLSEFRLPLQSPILVMALILFIILFSPIVMKKAKLPSIIGLIIAGVIIGPHALNLLENNSFVEIFSEIGILYIMFLAGLDLDLNEFKVNRNKSVVFGLYTFAIPLLIGYPALHFILGYGFNAAFLAASMFATHTLVTYPIVSRMELSRNQAVAVTVGGTILTDTGVMVILAIIIGNANGGLTQAFWIRLGISLVIFSAIMFLLIPRVSKWFFLSFEKEKHLHYIFVLAIVFFSAFLAKASGLEGIIGAFAAGLAINKLIPSSSALMNRIEFMGNALFIPFFLISVGMMVDISVVTHGWGAWMVAGVLTFVALCGKWLAAFLTQITFKFSKAQRQIIFGLSGAHAAATLAVVKVGFDHKIFDNAILNGTIILILVACIVASIVTERAGLKLKNEMEGDADVLIKGSPASKEQLLLMLQNVENIEKILNMAILIRDKTSPNPIALLSVVRNDEQAEVNVIKAKAELSKYIKEAPATETKINILATIDKNRGRGLERISREISADIILLDWINPDMPFDEIPGRKTVDYISTFNRNLFICHIHKPISLHNRMHLMVPPFAEDEDGFDLWLGKMAQLAKETSDTVFVYSNEKSGTSIRKFVEKNKLGSSFNYIPFTDWEDFFILARDIHPDDLIVLVSARKGAKSYVGSLSKLPAKFERYFQKNSYFVIFPQQSDYIPDENNPETQTIVKSKRRTFFWRRRRNFFNKNDD